MKNIFIISIVALLLTGTSGCKDWLDVNENPNELLELEEVHRLLPTAQINIANTIMGWDMGFSGAFYSQYWTQVHIASQFKFLDDYKPNEFGNAYRTLYTGALMDLDYVLQVADSVSVESLIAEALSIYSWQLVTDSWGNMPYAESLGGIEGNVNPAANTGQEIYSDLLKRADMLIALIEDENNDYAHMQFDTDYDFIFGNGSGHVDDVFHGYERFIYSLKLKLMLRLSETADFSNAALLSFVESTTPTGYVGTEKFLVDQTAMLPGSYWGEQAGKKHPMVEFEIGKYLSGNVIASKTFIDYLKFNSDPRLSILFDSVDDLYLGSLQGDYAVSNGIDSDGDGVDDNLTTYSGVTFEETSDIPFISSWEVNFYIAEVYARANDFVNAKVYYDAGVAASLSYWDIAETITGVGEYAEFVATDSETAIEQIALQKWVAYCKLQHIEAFYERNRVKYPAVNSIDVASNREELYANFPVGEFTISVEGRGTLSGSLPAAPIYPSAYINRNTSAPSQKLNISEKIWWDQKAGL